MNTHIKKILAISLVIVMCLSALPMLAPSASAAPVDGRGYVCLTFDNGFASDYDIAYPLMTEAGIPGTSFVTTKWTGTPGYMTVEQLQEMEASGWEIGSHSVTHSHMDELSPEDVLYEMTESKAILEGHGLTIESWAYPAGQQNKASRDIGDDIYVRQRGTGFLQNPYLPQYYYAISPDMRMVYAENPRTFDRLKMLVDGAIATDSLVILYWHEIYENGTLAESVTYADGIPYTIYEAIDYITQKMDSDGLTPIQFRDIGNLRADKVVTWTGAADGVASEGSNWDIGTAPPAGSYLLFPDGVTSNCTIDASADYAGIMMSVDYAGGVSIANGVDLHIRDGGIYVQRSPGLTAGDGLITCSGHVIARTSGPITGLKVHMVQYGAWFYTGGSSGQVDYLRATGHVIVPASTFVYNLTIDPGSRLTMLLGANLVMNTYSDSWVLDNRGTIDGEGGVTLIVNKHIEIAPGKILCNVEIRHRTPMTLDRVLTLTAPTVLGSLRIYSDQPYTITLNLDGHEMQVVNGVTVGQRGIIGNGTVYASSWDSSTGTLLDGTDIILRDGGSAKLAPGQSFHSLQIASDDGRTASWNMTAIGAQAPIVYGLRPGSVHTWYLDGVEQGNLTADANGTIALSYVSTGLHTLSVGPDPDAPAPISDMIGQYGWLILLLAGILAIGLYIMYMRHPAILIVGIGLLVVAALLKYGVL